MLWLVIGLSFYFSTVLLHYRPQWETNNINKMMHFFLSGWRLRKRYFLVKNKEQPKERQVLSWVSSVSNSNMQMSFHQQTHFPSTQWSPLLFSVWFFFCVCFLNHCSSCNLISSWFQVDFGPDKFLSDKDLQSMMKLLPSLTVSFQFHSCGLKWHWTDTELNLRLTSMNEIWVSHSYVRPWYDEASHVTFPVGFLCNGYLECTDWQIVYNKSLVCDSEAWSCNNSVVNFFGMGGLIQSRHSVWEI